MVPAVANDVRLLPRGRREARLAVGQPSSCVEDALEKDVKTLNVVFLPTPAARRKPSLVPGQSIQGALYECYAIAATVDDGSWCDDGEKSDKLSWSVFREEV